MAKMRRAALKLEPYDSRAIDGDGDGIVQEGTAWERPVGTRLLDEAGLEIRPGVTSGVRPTGARVVDSSGSIVQYRPSYGDGFGKPGQQAVLSRLGYRSLAERGLPNVAQLANRPTLGPNLNVTTKDIGNIVSPLPPKPGASGGRA